MCAVQTFSPILLNSSTANKMEPKQKPFIPANQLWQASCLPGKYKLPLTEGENQELLKIHQVNITLLIRLNRLIIWGFFLFFICTFALSSFGKSKMGSD